MGPPCQGPQTLTRPALRADLVEVLPDQFVAKRNYWLVVPDELVHLVRVRGFVSALLAIIEANPYLERRETPSR